MKNQNDFLLAKRWFFTHLVIYIIVMTILAIVNLTTTPGYLWVKWPLMGWGLGVLLNALTVFIFTDRSSLV